MCCFQMYSKPLKGTLPTPSSLNSHLIFGILFTLPAVPYLKPSFSENENATSFPLFTSREFHLLLGCTFTNSRIYWSKCWSVLYLSLPSLSHLSSFSACISVHLSFFSLIPTLWSPDRKWNIRFVKSISLFKCLEMMG